MPLLYQIALTLVHGIGNITARKLLEYTQSAEAVFKSPKSELLKIPGISNTIINNLQKKDGLLLAEKEIKNIEKNNISTLFILDKNYPYRLKQCIDAPALLYYKGQNPLLDAQKVLSIVGTRKPSHYGIEICGQIIESLKDLNIVFISGLAYGIDITAHKKCVSLGINNVAVIANGLGNIYPKEHYMTTKEIQNNGLILTEYLFDEKANRENFPKRNRIIAGLSDATIVIEAGEKSGAIITAELANSYDREVFAIPARITDLGSKGCLNLIKNNKAHLFTDSEDIIKVLSWDLLTESPKNQQKILPLDINEEQKQIIQLLKDNEKLNISEICTKMLKSSTQIAASLLELEIMGLINLLPGGNYTLN